MRHVRIGMLTPSSNTTLEPVTARMLAQLPDVSAHFGRFRVTEIGLGDKAVAQFDFAPMLAAAELLADARCEVICWNGTSAGWLGFERDRELCTQIERRTGIRACSVVLALDEVFKATRVQRFGLVSPYTDDVQAAIAANFRREGYDCVAEAHRGIRINFDFAAIPTAATAAMIREVARAAPDAIVVLCTNMDGATIADALEHELGIPVYDSIALALWGALRLAKVETTRIERFGKLFRELK